MRGRVVAMFGVLLVGVGLALPWGFGYGYERLAALLRDPAAAFESIPAVFALAFVCLPVAAAVTALFLWWSLRVAAAVATLAVFSAVAFLWLALKTGFVVWSLSAAPGLTLFVSGIVVLFVAAVLAARDRTARALRRMTDVDG